MSPIVPGHVRILIAQINQLLEGANTDNSLRTVISPALAVRLMGNPETNKGATRATKEAEKSIVFLNKDLLLKRSERPAV